MLFSAIFKIHSDYKKSGTKWTSAKIKKRYLFDVNNKQIS